jgi:ABC-2 type transport system permease protein
MSLVLRLFRELRFLLRQRAVAGLLVLAMLLSALSVTNGLAEIAHQRMTLERMILADKADRDGALAKAEDWGSAAYSSFHLTYLPPSDLAFAAMGQRDASPWKHRIHMLALEGQIHAADTANPELALAGRIDFAFIVSVLAPLLVILLLHDLRAGERAAGRHDLLIATAGQSGRLWPIRASALIATLAVCLLLPFWVGAALAGTQLAKVLAVSLLVCIHLLFWAAVSYWAGARAAAGSVILTGLIGFWLLLTAILPAITRVSIERAISIPAGGDIVLTQREAVNDAWDLPKNVTMEAFGARHPEWENYTQVSRPFEWKWYYAFQQVGDQTAEALSTTYREGIRERDQAAALAAFSSPPALVDRALQGLAGTDTRAALAYDASVRDFHTRLRTWYYPKLFRGEPFEPAALSALPVYQPRDERD